MAHRDLRSSLYLEFGLAAMLGDLIAVQAARNHRNLRARGVTVSKLGDLVIGTYCIEHQHTLLHDDRDVDATHAHLGLRVI